MGSDAGNYDFKVDPDDVNSTYGLIYRRVPHGAEVLDLGCASGNLALSLEKGRGCRVLGVDLDPDAVAAASLKGIEAVIADVASSPLTEVVAGRTFDRVILADVLEHLVDPGQLLSQVLSVLRPGGAVLVSIPNITHVDVQLMLAQGEWRYAPAGILDQTHLRFFTAHSFSELALKHGFEVTSCEEVHRPSLGTEVLLQGQAFRLSAADVRMVEDLNRGNRFASTYQLVMELTPLSPATERVPILFTNTKTDLPTLDVIVRTIPGREHLLSEALYSLVAVSDAKVHAIVVAHAENPDESGPIVELSSHYRELLSAIEVIPVTGRVGFRGYPLNVGLEASHAEFVAFLDDDDVVYPTFAQRLVGRLRADASLALAYGRTQEVRGDVVEGRFRALRRGQIYGKEFDLAELFFENYIPINSFVVRREAIRQAELRFDPNLEIFEDWLFLCELAARYRFGYVSHLVSEYRIRDDRSNAMHSFQERSRDVAHEAIEDATSGMAVRISAKELAHYASVHRGLEVRLAEENLHLHREVERLGRALSSVLGSRSWALTRPLRRLLRSQLPEG
jgi:methionine biosynthesis protein MetW